MTEAEIALGRIEEIVSDIQRLDAETKGKFRQASDRESFDLVCSIERKMQQKVEAA